ncbi:type II secretion system protein [Phycisphaerales bacterium AB-hyl4]|uniref:Type II secretion system protein n=1 Tax=Natronomicrosphaera hydrolytica TaxID=3242702 RepID=A0ABV4U9A7_9BACT
MSAHRKMAAKGFTLVEILIVVVILGILAAIVIPQFTRASESAQAASVASQLQTIRSQVELYQVQHNEYPNFADNEWADMTSTSLSSGYGPYFQNPPRNPLAPSDDKTAIITSGEDGAWLWDTTTNRVKAIVKGGNNVTDALKQAGLLDDADEDVEFGDFIVAGD